jgi:hypothetical protein
MEKKEVKSKLPSWIKDYQKINWINWIENRVNSLSRKAKKDKLPIKYHGIRFWRENVVNALCRIEDGKASYSKIPLNIDSKKKDKHPLYPSVDHVDGPKGIKIEIETRLVNDMKSILDIGEFKELVAQLVLTMETGQSYLKAGWEPKRTF